MRPEVLNSNSKRVIGKGFSKNEIQKAGLSMKICLNFGVHYDKRRKTCHNWNIEILKKTIIMQ